MMPENLSKIVNRGRLAYRRTSSFIERNAFAASRTICSRSNNSELNVAAAHLIEFSAAVQLSVMNNNE
jgi:hypothetical protein